jgi:mRNA interferase MazF
MVKDEYVPERGDIVWLNFNPGSGHEQMGRRPAVVISPKAYNEKVGLALFCPITSKIKDYPFEVKTDNEMINGVVLADQIKSLDWKVRDIEFITKETSEKVNEIIEKIGTLILE